MPRIRFVTSHVESAIDRELEIDVDLGAAFASAFIPGERAPGHLTDVFESNLFTRRQVQVRERPLTAFGDCARKHVGQPICRDEEPPLEGSEALSHRSNARQQVVDRRTDVQCPLTVVPPWHLAEQHPTLLVEGRPLARQEVHTRNDGAKLIFQKRAAR